MISAKLCNALHIVEHWTGQTSGCKYAVDMNTFDVGWRENMSGQKRSNTRNIRKTAKTSNINKPRTGAIYFNSIDLVINFNLLIARMKWNSCRDRDFNVANDKTRRSHARDQAEVT